MSNSQNMLVIPILLILAVLGSDCYICFSVLKQWPLFTKIALWIPTIVFFVSGYYMMRGNWDLSVTAMIVVLMCIIIPEFVFCIISLLGKIGSIAYKPIGHWANIAGVTLALIIAVCAAYGTIYGWKKLIVSDVEIRSASLPMRFDGYKIVQISDLHLGTFGNDVSHIRKMVKRINALNPDLIVFTGDLVNFTYQEILPLKEELKRLRAKDGVVSILGNHDYALYVGKSHTSASLVDKLIETERQMGWHLLLDENMPISRVGDTIWIAGVQNIGRHFSANKGNLEKALRGIPENSYTVLLSHDPTHWEDAVAGKYDIPLTLSGHTHSMQMRIFGWSPSSFIFKHWSGLYTSGSQYLYVSQGTGGNIPFRFGAWPEITLLSLKRYAVKIDEKSEPEDRK